MPAAATCPTYFATDQAWKQTSASGPKASCQFGEDAPDSTFIIGRISRPDPDKYSSNTWPIYARIPYPVRARMMAWDDRVEQKLGCRPDWSDCLRANAEPAAEFLGKLHCMVQINGGAGENWPRSGLEAMATGVPVVVQNQWGWREMVVHGETGYLCDTDEQIAYVGETFARFLKGR